MRCGKAQKLISAHRDGELDDARIEALQRHLSACEACKAFAGDLARVAEGLDSLTAPEPRWGFTDRLMSRLSGQQRVESSSSGWLGLLRPAPVGVAVAAFSLGAALTVLVNGELPAAGAGGREEVESLAGDYFDTLAEVSVERQLLALLPETEE